MKFLLIVVLVFAVSCATMGAKNSNPGVEVMGTSRISECGDVGVAINVAFQDALNKMNIAQCKLFEVVSVCIFPKQDRVEVILRGKECNPPRRVNVVPKEKAAH